MMALDSEATALISSIHSQISQLAVKRFSQMNLASELQLQRCALMFCCAAVVVVLGLENQSITQSWSLVEAIQQLQIIPSITNRTET
jgi:hypothetical protein